jgi:hypothetical protein
MIEEFKYWSETNPDAKERISPKLGIREWDTITKEEKVKVLLHFTNQGWFKLGYSNLIYLTIIILNERFKYKSYGIKTLEKDDVQGALSDFHNIFITEKQDIVFEMCSIYAKNLINENFLKFAEKTQNPEEKKRI